MDFETKEDLDGRLKVIEQKLALELGLDSTGIRPYLIELSKTGKLKETRLVRDWNELYSAYVGCFARTSSG